MPEFTEFPKIHRLFREMIVTEKLDGTNAQVFISEDGLTLTAGSRTRWITPEDDNFGFARWCRDNETELIQLGPGKHFGEWWGQGIQRNYGLTEKRFSLFNVSKWTDDSVRPACCSVVPVLHSGIFDTGTVQEVMDSLQSEGSRAAPGFMKPEGVVVFHVPANRCFKATIEKDEEHKTFKK